MNKNIKHIENLPDDFKIPDKEILKFIGNLFEMINLHRIDQFTLTVFLSLFESNTLNKATLNQVCIVFFFS